MIDFQAVKWGGVDISARALPSEAHSVGDSRMHGPPAPPPLAYRKTPPLQSAH